MGRKLELGKDKVLAVSDAAQGVNYLMLECAVTHILHELLYS